MAVTPNAPVVAGRDAVVRAYVSASSYPRSIRGELEVRDGARVVAVHEASASIAQASDDGVPASLLSFDVPASEITPSTTFAARIVDAAGESPGPTHPAQLPRDGSGLSVGARDDGEGLHLVLVPLRWDGDGSGRLPDTSDAWLATVRAVLTSLYPIVDLQIEVHAAVPYSGGLTWSGNVDFGDVNSVLMDLRMADHAPARAYYYGIVAPDTSLDSYCGGSCVTGQSYVADDPLDGDYRVGSGVDFGTEDSAWTLAHEVGHEHGRYHAPCDTSGADADYPYSGGEIGVWGYDPRTRTFLPPSGAYDFMGYCEPQWISDYTWSAIFERTLAVSALAAPRRDAFLVRVGGGTGVVVGRRSVATPHGPLAPYTFLGRDGAVLLRGVAPAVRQSHTDERLVVMPLPPASAVAVRVDGTTLEL
ncbi:MAG: M66 family metalloprotease [Sandaracinus sp.]